MASKAVQAAYRERHRERVRTRARLFARKKWANETERSREKQRVVRAKIHAQREAEGRPRPDRCECCGRPPNGRHKTLVHDHCHLTGLFRGWLCNNCNTALGLLEDRPELAVEYLRRAYR